jgi:hypothetical protein
MKPFVTIGVFIPPWETWRAWKIGEALVKRTAAVGLQPHHDPVHGCEPRASWSDESLHAQVRRFNYNGPGGDWHYDGDTTDGANPNCAMVLWTNTHPTEFKNKGESTIYTPKAYEIVLFNNMTTLHRRPANAPEKRWVFRQRVRLPKDLL